MNIFPSPYIHIGGDECPKERWKEIRIWTEWVKDAKKMEWELLPRLAALCEVQWTQKEQRNLDSFLQRMLHIHDIYRLKNLNYKEDIEAAVKN